MKRLLLTALMLFLLSSLRAQEIPVQDTVALGKFDVSGVVLGNMLFAVRAKCFINKFSYSFTFNHMTFGEGDYSLSANYQVSHSRFRNHSFKFDFVTGLNYGRFNSGPILLGYYGHCLYASAEIILMYKSGFNIYIRDGAGIFYPDFGNTFWTVTLPELGFGYRF